MSLLKTLLLGRENGIRSKIRKAVLGGGAEDTSPGSSYSAPRPSPERQPAPAERALGLKPEAPKDVTPPEGFEVVLHKDALKPGKIVEVIIGGTAVAVANVDGTFYACTNACPHAEGPLGDGSLDGSVVTCPYHGWKFDLKSGASITNPGVTLKTYPVAIEKTAVCVQL